MSSEVMRNPLRRASPVARAAPCNVEVLDSSSRSMEYPRHDAVVRLLQLLGHFLPPFEHSAQRRRQREHSAGRREFTIARLVRSLLSLAILDVARYAVTRDVHRASKRKVIFQMFSRALHTVKRLLAVDAVVGEKQILEIFKRRPLDGLS